MSHAVDDLVEWLAENDPDTMPYWPGATHSGGFGYRTSRALLDLGASPIHLGVDRAGGAGPYRMPFDGRIEWSVVGGAPGTFLRIRAEELRLELHVFHTEAEQGVESIAMFLRRGDPIPVRPGEAGLSDGVHTHTEVALPYDQELREWLTEGQEATIVGGRVSLSPVRAHCARHDLPECAALQRIDDQIRTWEIDELWEHAAVRRALPSYRQPGWHGSTLLVDSAWLLKI